MDEQTFRRGDIFIADLSLVLGNEQGGKNYPVLIDWVRAAYTKDTNSILPIFLPLIPTIPIGIKISCTKSLMNDYLFFLGLS